MSDPNISSSPGADSVEAIDRQISELREPVAHMREDVRLEKLEGLYRQKVDLLKAKPAAEQPDSLRSFQQQQTEQQQAIERAGNQQTPMSEADLELRSELVNAWGNQYEDRLQSSGEFIGEVFQTKERFNSFAKTLPADVQRSVLYQLSEALSMEKFQSDEEAENCFPEVDKKLEALWGENVAVNGAAARRGLIKVFGSIKRYEGVTTNRNLSADAHVKILLAAAEIGRLTK